MSSKKKTSIKRDIHSSSVHWFSTDYWLQNGFLLSASAHSAICKLIALGRFDSMDSVIREGIRMILEENMPLLSRNDGRWIVDWVNEGFNKDPSRAKPDVAGEENLRFLEKMYEGMRKAEAEN